MATLLTSRSSLSNFLGRPFKVVVLVIILLSVLFPLYWLVINSFKPEQEYFATPPVMFPRQPTAAHFGEILNKYQLGRGFLNSFLVGGLTAACTVFFGSLAAYSLVNGFLPKRLKELFAGWFLIQKMYPAIVVAVPVFFIISRLHLMDNILALVLMNTSFNLPLVLLIMIGFYQDIPYEMEEQGMLEGCNLWQRYAFLTTPMTKASLVAVGMLTFVASWNEFLYAVILTVVKAKTLTVIIAGFITDKGLAWGPMAAMGLVIILPVVVLMWALQRDFVSGVSAGALKG